MNSDEQRYYMWSCDQCNKDLFDTDPYAEIMLYRPHPEKCKRWHFCLECFDTIAGKEYM